MKDMERSRKTIFKLSVKLNSETSKGVEHIPDPGTDLSSHCGRFSAIRYHVLQIKCSPKGPFGGLYLKMPKESQTIVKNWQEKGITLINQLKSILRMKEPVKDAVKDATNKNKAQALLAKNRLAKAKEARTRTGNLSHRENSVVSPNSSRTLALVQPLMMTSSIMTGSGGSEGSSYSPSNSGEDSSAKDIENNHLVVAVTSNISENQLNSNKSISNESVSNDSVSNDSVSNDSVSNDSVSNDSVSNDSVSNDSVSNDSVSNDSVSNDSVSNDSVSNDSVSNDSVFNESVMSESIMNESLLNEPVMNDQVRINHQ